VPALPPEPDDPVVSAVVTIRRPATPPETGQENRDFAAISKVKSHLTLAGFEVAAPLGTTFSITAARSHFEQFFGDALVVDDGGLLRSVTTEGGGRDLSLGGLPDEVREKVESVSFVPPPDLPRLPG
jgi:hypothetical protein